jgi:Carboxypeptidase regulatory-like domain
MKFVAACVIAGTLLLSCPAKSQTQSVQSGDTWKWIPFDSKMSAKDAQIVRNAQYVSVKIQAAHVSYKSGFLENIKQIVVTSNVSFDLDGRKVEGTIVNRTWEKAANSEDDIPVNDLLADLSPASPTSIKLKVDFSGIGQDKFKRIFDVLANPDIKTAINLSPAAIAQSGLATSIMQKFLATPYTSDKPKSVLSMSQGFVIYSNRDKERVDSLNEGYIVVISGSENKSADLTRVKSLGPDDLRFDTGSHSLQMKQSNGSWKLFTGNSYVVLSITVDSVRGRDESSAWYKKFSEAERVAEKILTGDPKEGISKDALSLWNEGSTLLSADTNYIEEERKKIRLTALADIQNDLNKVGVIIPTLRTIPGAEDADKIAADYQSELAAANLESELRVLLRDAQGRAISGAEVTIQNTYTGKVFDAKTDSSGYVHLDSLKPGNYVLRAVGKGFTSFEGQVAIQPRENKTFELKPPMA